jgi:hypothetical protein
MGRGEEPADRFNVGAHSCTPTGREKNFATRAASITKDVGRSAPFAATRFLDSVARLQSSLPDALSLHDAMELTHETIRWGLMNPGR